MAEQATVRDPEAFSLVSSLVREGLRYIRSVREKEQYVSQHFQWPDLSWFETGLPNLSVTTMGGPPNYGTALRPQIRFLSGMNDADAFDIAKTADFESLAQRICSDSSIFKYFVNDEVPAKHREFWVSEFISSLVDRYCTVYVDTEFSESRLLNLYIPLEAGFTLDILPADLIVPILFLGFEDEGEPEVADSVSIFRMNDEFHLARADKHAFGPGVHKCVMSAATHALRLTGYEIKNEPLSYRATIASNVSAYPLHKIDLFFAALRAVSGFDTGYAQLLAAPKGWAKSYTASIPYLEGTSIRRYPERFENYYWLKPVRVVSRNELHSASKLFRHLLEASESHSGKRLLLATHRLNRCFLRENEEDAILDATIGLEVLLATDEREEITHKLAMRLAALSTLADDIDEGPSEVYRRVKQVYAMRSAVAHGSVKSLPKAREIKLTEERRIPTLEVAIKYLRIAIKTLACNQEYLAPSAIDELLLGALEHSMSEAGREM